MAVNFCLVNQSAAVTDAQLAAIGAACLIQLQRDLSPAWNLAPSQFTVGLAAPETVPAGAVRILLSDLTNTVEDGFHSLGPTIVVYAAQTIAQGAVSSAYPCLSQVISHELCETAVDWACDQYDALGYFEEVCDGVNETGYSIDGIFVSNFVYPQWFLIGSTGPWDFCGLLAKDHALTPEGYGTVVGANGLTPVGRPDRPQLKAPSRIARKATTLTTKKVLDRL